MTEAAGSSETLVSLYQIPCRRIPKELYEATMLLRGLSPRANYTDRAAAAGRRS